MGTFNPYAIERDSLELGPHGTFVIGDLTKPRDRRMTELRASMEKLEADATAAEHRRDQLAKRIALLDDGTPEHAELAAELAQLDEAAAGDNDTAVKLLVGMLVTMLDGAPADLEQKLLDDWESGVLGVGSIRAAVEHIDKQLEGNDPGN